MAKIGPLLNFLSVYTFIICLGSLTFFSSSILHAQNSCSMLFSRSQGQNLNHTESLSYQAIPPSIPLAPTQDIFSELHLKYPNRTFNPLTEKTLYSANELRKVFEKDLEQLLENYNLNSIPEGEFFAKSHQLMQTLKNSLELSGYRVALHKVEKDNFSETPSHLALIATGTVSRNTFLDKILNDYSKIIIDPILTYRLLATGMAEFDTLILSELSFPIDISEFQPNQAFFHELRHIEHYTNYKKNIPSAYGLHFVNFHKSNFFPIPGYERFLNAEEMDTFSRQAHMILREENHKNIFVVNEQWAPLSKRVKSDSEYMLIAHLLNSMDYFNTSYVRHFIKKYRAITQAIIKRLEQVQKQLGEEATNSILPSSYSIITDRKVGLLYKLALVNIYGKDRNDIIGATRVRLGRVTSDPIQIRQRLVEKIDEALSNAMTHLRDADLLEEKLNQIIQSVENKEVE